MDWRNNMILLTSISKRRKELLQQIGFREGVDFVQEDSHFKFDYHEEKSKLTLEEVKQMAVRVARQKINLVVEISQKFSFVDFLPKETVVVGADTVVFSDDQVWDRPLPVNPRSVSPKRREIAKEEAKLMLSSLRGKEFSVITGLVLAQGDNLENELSKCVVTQAKMKEVSD
ncbi:TPA: hypothetical protein EYP70_04680, partial [Candidatus Bathyarchaeota archaeon]|nr:hypothetical protein [Candidatus Bathyarchaeota archaeon]